MSDVIIVNVKPKIVMTLRRLGRYQDIAQLLPRLFQYAQENKIEILGPPPIFICYEKDEKEAQKADQEGKTDPDQIRQ